LVKQDDNRQRSRCALGDELHDALQQLVRQPRPHADDFIFLRSTFASRRPRRDFSDKFDEMEKGNDNEIAAASEIQQALGN
jgi:hypothetical protein